MLIYYFYINGTYVIESFVFLLWSEEEKMVVWTYLILIISFSFQKQLNSLNKITSNLLDIINSSKDEWENDASK